MDEPESSEMGWEAFRKHRQETEHQLLKLPYTEEFEASSGTVPDDSNQLLAAEARRSLPLELLAEEWLEKHPGGETDSKAYVIDKLLPTLILGLEHLLTEVRDNSRPA